MAAIRSGTPGVEDLAADELTSALESGFRPTTDEAALGDCDAFVIAVPTDVVDGTPDMSAVEAAAESIAARRGSAEGEYLVVVSSTVYPGATDDVVAPVFDEADSEPLLAMVPERVNPGGEYDFAEIPLVVGAHDERSRAAAQALFESVVEETHPVDDPAVAEAAKVLENTYRMVNIGLVNELSALAEAVGFDIWATIDAAATKPFGFQPFYPGPGVGGHCIPVDPQFFAWCGNRTETPLEVVEAAAERNGSMPRRVVDDVCGLLASRGRALDEATVVLLGVTYKPDVGDVRNAPSRAVWEAFLERGATVAAVDPHVESVAVGGRDRPIEDGVDAATLESADAVVVLVDHGAFDFEQVTARSSLVYDTRGVVPDGAATVVRLGGDRAAGADGPGR